MNCRYRLSSPPTGGAIGILSLAGDITAALNHLQIKPVQIGRAVVREWLGVDTVVVACLAPNSAMIFPHAGPAVLRRALEALDRAGLTRTDALPAQEEYPEARSLLEARMLAALARAESPLAIDLLLDQPRRWLSAESDPALRHTDPANRLLNRLIDPPLVVALGPPNIGKSSLLNALAGRGVAIVADLPGTTRDHVGVSLDLAGLVVRYIDTPGIGAAGLSYPPHAAIDQEAQHLALHVAATADLLVLCADAESDYIQPPNTAAAILRISLRSDLGRPAAESDIAVSVRDNTGLDVLTRTIRDRLIPPDLVTDPRAWRFW